MRKRIILTTAAVAAIAAPLLWSRGLPQRVANQRPAGFFTTGAAAWTYLGDEHRDISGEGFALDASHASGDVTGTVKNLDPAKHRWYRLSFRGLPEANFAVGEEDLYMRVAFFGRGGQVSYDAKALKFYDQVQQARTDLAVNGDHGERGAEAWREYHLDVMLPFPQVDTVKATVGFAHGQAQSPREAAFLVADLAFTPIEDPAGLPVPSTQPTVVVPNGKLIALGGRWSYAAKPGETAAPKVFDTSNVDRLLYHDATWSAPFAGNTRAILRAGFMDAAGQVVTQDRVIENNVTIEFQPAAMVVHTHGVPNHPTGRFPEPGFGNPSYIQEQLATYYIPLNPKENPAHTFTDENNANHALNMGPIGIALNGVVFFNPFDAGSQDATSFMDRCCGHPNPDNQYHYHKYPICVNSPWFDAGGDHSALIGFAFDGFPVYGPYETTNVMAKDLTGEQGLNEFNMHYDEQRGWHYHVTPGKFPYLIGGYWGTMDPRDKPKGHRGPPPGGAGGGGPRRPGGPGGPPGGGPDDRPPPPPPL